MNKNQRYDSLDIIKGFCCILMVVAHQAYFYSDPILWLGVVQFVAGLIPPQLFFAISGVTASLQSLKYSFRSLMLYFCALFVIGFAWSVALHGDVTAFYWPEIFQLIALGSMLVCVTERNGPVSQKFLFLMAAGFILLKPALELLYPSWPRWNFLFCDPRYTNDMGGGSLLPGFPLFPWGGYFFLGLWCHRAAKNQKFALAIISLCLTILSAQLGSNVAEKWDTSVAYSAASCTDVFIVFWLFHDPVATRSKLGEQLRKIGSNALLFFFVHPIGLVAGGALFAATHNALLGWSVAIAIAILMFNLLNRCRPAKVFQRAPAWYVLMTFIVALPLSTLLISSNVMPVLTRLVAVTLGAIAAINFSSLSAIIKVRKAPPGLAQI